MPEMDTRNKMGSHLNQPSLRLQGLHMKRLENDSANSQHCDLEIFYHEENAVETLIWWTVLMSGEQVYIWSKAFLTLILP